MRGLRETGFFDLEKVEIGGAKISPMEMTAKLLLKEWAFEEQEEDLTVMRIQVDGEKDGKSIRHSYHMFDRYDAETDTSSMARTTGYTCTSMVRLVARNLYTEVGISPPELVGRDKACFESVFKDLEERNIRFRHEVEKL
jgi:saccharopine dehydrogenase-like NADP-dependent oxidoreductase